MIISPFDAMYKATKLSKYAFGNKTFIPTFATSEMEIYPYQIAAASFAMRSPYLKGVILCDEGSLGKTYETLLVISEMYFEGKDKILIIVPMPLLGQWIEIMNNKMCIPFKIVREKNLTGINLYDAKEIVITTYETAYENA